MNVRLTIIVLLALLLVGCRDLAFGPYVSPRVTGQVVDEDTAQPLAGVKVTRGRPELAAQPGWTPHGGELLIRRPPTLTGPDGRFTLLSERVLTPAHWGGWSSVRLTFERAGYLSLQTNCSAANRVATNTAAGAPALDAGRITLQKAPAKPKRP